MRLAADVRRKDKNVKLDMKRRNPARAGRSEYRRRTPASEDEDVVFEWTEHPPTLTEGHLDLPAVRKAKARARRAAVEGEPLGRGNFGKTYVLDSGDDRVLVKIAAERMLYQDGRPWSLAEQRRNLMHEAGVANELEELGYRIVPHSEYVELVDGTPVIVREYGELIQPGELTGQEFYDVERALLALEREAGWRVQDELLLLRRADGSVFVGDVGLWQPPTIQDRLVRWRAMDTDLDPLLQDLSDNYFGIRVPSLAMVTTWCDKLLELLGGRWPSSAGMTLDDVTAALQKRVDAGQLAQVFVHIGLEAATSLFDAVEERQALGIPSPCG